MTHSEQHALIEELKGFRQKMSRDDASAFEMMVKRDKDDEDLDELTVRTLERLYGTFKKKKSKDEMDRLWDKFNKQK